MKKHLATCPVAGMMVFNEREQVLLVLQRMYKTGHRAMWTLPKGKMKAGERPFTAAKRELEEETGLTLDSINWDEDRFAEDNEIVVRSSSKNLTTFFKIHIEGCDWEESEESSHGEIIKARWVSQVETESGTLEGHRIVRTTKQAFDRLDYRDWQPSR